MTVHVFTDTGWIQDDPQGYWAMISPADTPLPEGSTGWTYSGGGCYHIADPNSVGPDLHNVAYTTDQKEATDTEFDVPGHWSKVRVQGPGVSMIFQWMTADDGVTASRPTAESAEPTDPNDLSGAVWHELNSGQVITAETYGEPPA